MNKILVVDDDEYILKSIDLLLKSGGYSVETASDGIEALEKVTSFNPDLIIMDIMMPGMDGISALMRIRERESIPVIMLSAKGETEDKVIGLNAGADDYVTKPFSGFELMARVNSHLRRQKVLKEDSMILSTGGVTMDDRKKLVEADGKTVTLTPNEYRILKFLLQNKGIVFTSEEIYEKVWNEEALDIKKIISLHISHIRDKIEIDPKNPDYLISIYGMGYKLEDR